MLTHATVAADNDRFMAGEDAVRQRLLGAQPLLADRLALVPGVEVRSSGSMQVVDDWRLPGAGQRTGSEAMALSLRAAGDLVIAASLSDGFGAPNAPGSVARDGSAATLRLIAGADLQAADPRTPRDPVTSMDAGDLRIGRNPATPGGSAPTVVLRTTVGRIEMVASRDLRMLNSGVRIYTTGVPLSAGTLPEWARVGLGSNQTLNDGGQPVGPFFEGAGEITMNAGRDIVGSPTRQYVTDWWWRQASPNAAGTPAAWWSRYDQFQQGVASFGGGNIVARAGRDVVDLEASTPSSGYSIGAATTADGRPLPAAALTLPGGHLAVTAGRDVVSGLLFGGGARASVDAGGSLRPAEATGLGLSHPGLQLFYGNTAWRLSARGDLVLGNLVNPGLMAGVVQASGSARTDLVAGLDPAATLQALSLAGGLAWTGSRTPISPSGDPRNVASDPARQAPGQLTLATLGGDLTVSAPVLQRPVGDARLQLLADGALSVGLVVAGAASPPRPVVAVARAEATNALMQRWRQTDEAEPQLDIGSRDPVRLVSRSGDVVLGADLRLARPLRAVAARDLRGSGSSAASIQHQAAGEISLLQAGRDLLLADDVSARVRLAGPGDLLVLAGRDIDLRRAAGLISTGNQDNPRLLAPGGARITLVSGVNWEGADYRAALAAGLQLAAGGAGLTTFEGELWTWLSALDAGQAPPPVGSPALAAGAAAWRARDADERSAAVRQRVGEATWAAGLRDAMRRHTGLAALDETAALAAFAELDALRRGEIEQALRAALLAAAGPGEAARTFTGALYLALPREQQALRLHDVLFAELRAAGRVAARLPSGPEREAAYASGYAALRALYPTTDDSPRPRGDIRLSASQIKTQQGGDIRLLAPGGSIDAGALAGAGGKRPADLGILSAGGGNIEAAARGDFAVNQSRVFTLARGDLLIWSSEGSIDAGRGAKTVTGAPPPVFTIDRDGNFVVDVSGSFSGSGIAVLDSRSALDLYAPRGEISAGEAGIASRGIAFIAGDTVRGSDFSFGGGAVGAPAKADGGGATAGLAALSPAPAVAAARAAGTADDEEDPRRRRTQRRNLLLEFLGFGTAE